MTSFDRFLVPVSSAVKLNFTDWCCQNLSKRALNALTVQASTTELGKLFQTRACLDQLLIAIRSLLIVCDHMRSKERLIAINRPIATPLGGGVLSKCRCHCLADYKHSMGRAGRWRVSESVAAAARAVLR